MAGYDAMFRKKVSLESGENMRGQLFGPGLIYLHRLSAVKGLVSTAIVVKIKQPDQGTSQVGAGF